MRRACNLLPAGALQPAWPASAQALQHAQAWRWQHTMPSAAGQPASEAPPQASTSGAPADKLVLYRGKWILPVRLLVRGKVFQLLGFGVLGLAAAGLTAEALTGSDLFWLALLGIGCVGGSVSLNYYSRRYVGELVLLLPQRRTARFSTLDFWGNRQDADVAVERIQPPFKGLHPKRVRELTAQLLFPVNVRDDRQYYMSVAAGTILERELLFKLLSGEPVGPQAAAPGTGSAPGDQGGAPREPDAPAKSPPPDGP